MYKWYEVKDECLNEDEWENVLVNIVYIEWLKWDTVKFMPL